MKMRFLNKKNSVLLCILEARNEKEYGKRSVGKSNPFHSDQWKSLTCPCISSGGTHVEKDESPNTRNLSWGLSTSSRTSGSGNGHQLPPGAGRGLWRLLRELLQQTSVAWKIMFDYGKFSNEIKVHHSKWRYENL